MARSSKIAVGVDIVEICRIEDLISSRKGTFLDRIYTNSELEMYRNMTSSLAARFAAKEAVMKALGSGVEDLRWQDIEILSDTEGAPIINLYGKAQDKARDIGITEFSVSLSHSKQYAIAFVVGDAV